MATQPLSPLQSVETRTDAHGPYGLVNRDAHELVKGVLAVVLYDWHRR